jgi:hypothetical protein
MSEVREIVSCKYYGLKNFLIKYRDKEGDLVSQQLRNYIWLKSQLILKAQFVYIFQKE